MILTGCPIAEDGSRTNDKMFNFSGVYFFLFQPVAAQNVYVPSNENLKNREWFQDAKFGMFIHWGVYSVLGQGEWVVHNRMMEKKTYEHLATFFNPVEFNPEEWVSLAKAAGMQYITFTARHHDGFSMFNTQQSDWNIVKRTPYRKDVLKMLADECRRQGIKLFLYYSHLDWYHNDYYPRGSTGQHSGRPERGDWDMYIDFINTQLTELLTNYGEIAGIWFDGMWDRRDVASGATGADWGLDETYRLIHSIQSHCLIGNNHHSAPNDGEDFQMFEKDLPGQNLTGYRTETTVGDLPLETCETMNNSWGFNIFDKDFKSTKDLIQYLVSAAGHNTNLLLNVGPMPNGKIQPEFVETLKEIGTWVGKNSETIYGTRGGPVPPKIWGVTTQKDNRVYVHNLSGETHLLIPDFGKTVKRISLFTNDKALRFNQDEFGITIKSPPEMIDEIDTILVLEL
jgi:alpha-L-fucosidase